MASSGFRLRKATEADIGFLTHVLLVSNQDRYGKHPGWEVDEFRRAMTVDAADQVAGKIPDSTTYLIIQHDTDVGRLRLVSTTAMIEIAGLQILPQYQNRGIGTAVINSVLDHAVRTGIPVELEVESDNPDARRLYERLGFRDTGVPVGDCHKMIFRTDADSAPDAG